MVGLTNEWSVLDPTPEAMRLRDILVEDRHRLNARIAAWAESLSMEDLSRLTAICREESGCFCGQCPTATIV